LKRKILQICKYNLNAPGGIEIVSKIIHLNFKNNFKITSLSFKKDDKQEILSNEVSKKIDFFIMNQPISFRYFIYLIKKARELDNVIYHHPNPFALFAILIFLKSETKLTIFWHSDILKGWLLGKLLKPIEKISVSLAQNIIFTSRSYMNSSYIKPHLNPDKVKILPLGVAEPTFEIVHCGTIGQPIQLIFIGRLETYKGVVQMLEELSLAKQEVHLTIVGDGSSYRKVLDKCKIVGDHIKIQMLKNVDEEEKYRLLSTADFLILPSRTRAEAYGVVLIEALSLGTPIIVRKVDGSGMNDISDDFDGLKVGFLYEDMSQNTLSIVLKKISNLSDHEYLNMRMAAKEKFERYYKLETFEEKLRDII